MAEAWVRHLKGEVIEACSAGIEKHGLDRRAVQVMAEVGIDISGQLSKLIEELGGLHFDYVVTVCDHARESCPFFPGNAKMVHAGFEDPPALAAEASSEDEALEHYRRVRDQIKAFVESLPERLSE